ncbi:uncharacterized protein JKF63_07944 [Porcisia hertigi]|uniref:Srp40 C-terminal domain-containing protein n=1 Tax=Porcisia hertigi TaxID=2761500 RepID=A0A836HBG2_9TRYP|nr:hypothetical protein JKF63_07944 [Porcisia hertigi]
MSRNVDYLVMEYLAEVYPSVAKALRRDAPSTRQPSHSPFGKKSLQEVVMKYRLHRSTFDAVDTTTSSDDDNKVQQPRLEAAKASSRKPIPNPSEKKSLIAESDSDGEPVRRPAVKKASPKVAPARAVADSDSSGDDEPVRRPAVKKASPKVAPARAVADSDSSGDDEPVTSKLEPRKAPASRTNEEPAWKAARMEPAGAGRHTHHHVNEDGTLRRFQRIDPSKVTFYSDALRDNRPGEEHLALRQNQEMMRTKGKGFNKLKQKNKGKFYGAGVDLSVRAYQFPDSDDE